MQTEEDIDMLDKQMDTEREAQSSSGGEEGEDGGSDDYY
jgi:hypothetical protein